MTALKPQDLHVDADLLDHTRHLPEVIECHCGYHRENCTVDTLSE